MSRTTWLAQAPFMRPGDMVRGIRFESLRGGPEIVLSATRKGRDTEVTYMVVGEPGTRTTTIASKRKVEIQR